MNRQQELRQTLDEVRGMSVEQLEAEIQKAGLKPLVDAMMDVTCPRGEPSTNQEKS